MKPKAACLIAAIATMTVIAASSLRGVSQQVWSPQVARAAKVTVSLLKGNAIAPMRPMHNPTRSQPSTKPNHS
jgi:hypothetical protein